jgi:hypothetical protein
MDFQSNFWVSLRILGSILFTLAGLPGVVAQWKGHDAVARVLLAALPRGGASPGRVCH